MGVIKDDELWQWKNLTTTLVYQTDQLKDIYYILNINILNAIFSKL